MAWPSVYLKNTVQETKGINSLLVSKVRSMEGVSIKKQTSGKERFANVVVAHL